MLLVRRFSPKRLTSSILWTIPTGAPWGEVSQGHNDMLTAVGIEPVLIRTPTQRFMFSLLHFSFSFTSVNLFNQKMSSRFISQNPSSFAEELQRESVNWNLEQGGETVSDVEVQRGVHQKIKGAENSCFVS